MPEVKKFIQRQVYRYTHSNRWFRALIESVLLTLPMYGSAILSYYVRHALDEKHMLEYSSAITVVILLIFFLARRLFEMMADGEERILQLQRDAIGQAHTFTDDLLALQTADVRRAAALYSEKGDGDDLFRSAIAGKKYIQEVVERLYLVLEALYSGPRDRLTQIMFEVTFMTKDYSDEFITIWAWRNRDRRAPRSLLMRGNNPHIYANTVTATVYESERPEMIIIEDTRNNDDYKEIYAGQKHRILSSIIYPVFADNNELLGTLVTHCDRPMFFKICDQRFWASLLEIYAKRIAHQKVCLDVFRSVGDLTNWVSTVDIDRC